jgi:hypothetical protein
MSPQVADITACPFLLPLSGVQQASRIYSTRPNQTDQARTARRAFTFMGVAIVVILLISMSALARVADSSRTSREVREVPEAARRHLVGAGYVKYLFRATRVRS